MLRTISTLIALGAITTACSGGGSGSTSVDTSDKTAPTVTLTASSSTIQGGETVALTAKATDNIDGSVEAKLSCTSGTLVGDLLVTGVATAVSTINCTATAIDKAGNTGTANLAIQVGPTVSVMAPSTPSQTLQAGEIASFQTQNLTLDQEGYAGKIAGKDVTFYRDTDSKGLSFLTPEGLPLGDQRAIVTVGSKTYSFVVKIEATPTVSDPRATVLAYLTTRKAELQAAIADPAAGITGAKRTQAQQYVTQMQAAIDAIDTVAAADLRATALMVISNPVTIGTSSGASLRKGEYADSCSLAAANFAFSGAVVAAITALFSKALPAAGTPFGIGILAAGAALGAITYKYGVIESLGQVLNYCLLRNVKLLLKPVAQAKLKSGVTYVNALAAEPTYSFKNKTPVSFDLVREDSFLPEISNTIRGNLNRLYDIVVKIATPATVLTQVHDIVQGPVTAPAEAGGVSLSGISRGDIQGSVSGSGSTVTLTFTAIDAKDENIDFSFRLKPADADAITVNAQLSLSLPRVNGASLTLRQGVATTSAVQVQGTDSLEVTEQPAHGAVTLRSDGTFTYTPSGQYFGEDRFLYRGRNANGVSQPATVLLNIRREFEGSWSIVTRSVTRAQSSPGLCPNETNNFTIQISKVSDTQYSTSYMGVPLNFMMGSANDPNGLTTTWSGTYDDAPGKTTETVTIRIPDSTHINGETSWSYAGPNGTSCSGSTTITGTR